MNRFVRVVLIAACALTLFIAPVTKSVTRAQDQEIGYLWQLQFDFNHDFNGILTIEVGPWKNGNLVSVDETSTTRISCRPIGNVTLNAGEAVFFDGGYVACEMDLQSIVAEKHNLYVDAIDDYGSMVVSARVNTDVADTPIRAPLFTHPDATFGVVFPSTFAVDMVSQLSNGVGSMTNSFPGVSPGAFVEYEFYYGCSGAGPCFARFDAAAQTATQPIAGSRVNFSSEPAVFEIGRNGAATLTGRIDWLIVDPGNSAH